MHRSLQCIKNTDLFLARTDHRQRFRQSISKRAMSGFWNDARCAACLRGSLFMFVIFVIFVSGRAFSPEQ